MISLNRYPVEIVLFMVWSVILLPIGLLDVGGVIRVILGLPFILFIPGYVLIFALFPTRKTDRGINLLERITLSFGFSLAIVSLIGFGLNYTTWGIRLESILLCVFVFIIAVGAIAIYQWNNVSLDERFEISLGLSRFKSKSKLNRILNISIIISILFAIIAITYASITITHEEKYTGFYILSMDRNTTHYQKNLTVGENSNVILGIINHEYETIDYNIEIWLINQSTDNTKSENEDKTTIHNMWFIDNIPVNLKHKELNIEKAITTQWEHNYSFSINRTGSFKLLFLLFTSPAEEYIVDDDYVDIAEEKINSAYRQTHLWIKVN